MFILIKKSFACGAFLESDKKPIGLIIIADTMVKFATFENVVEMIYKYVIPKPKEECSKQLQLGISFAGGYIAGVLCAVISHPADNLVSFLNNANGATVADVSPTPSLLDGFMLSLSYGVCAFRRFGNLGFGDYSLGAYFFVL